LFDWAGRAETLYATQVVRTALNEAEVMVQKGATDAALAREGLAEERVREAQIQVGAQRARAKRMGILAGIAAGAVVVLGAVVTGMALTR